MTGDSGRSSGDTGRSDGTVGPSGGRDDRGGTIFDEIDPDLNIFALANGLDLHRDRSDRPDRVLEWYRDGMVRRARIVAVEIDRLEVHYGAARRATGDGPQGWWPLAEGLDGPALASSLRSLLADAVARADELTRDEIEGS